MDTVALTSMNVPTERITAMTNTENAPTPTEASPVAARMAGNLVLTAQPAWTLTNAHREPTTVTVVTVGAEIRPVDFHAVAGPVGNLT
jgi:hypothetical protein